ncbi:DUF4145 domain-containing protein [Janthinobacterium sp. SUN026]|uniref:DUF4145 domain-containing protein n=1 Tax=Janthinobacterium sp. SUN026 TaxID=3002438 RepID=UPI0025B08520|nr:DUF4145 domain-containing protein [Janthinobacterium sp. SUN026]MDN2671420.1 DUF4145 domain-containing protein [Janthinobacterium sp. SUN026]
MFNRDLWAGAYARNAFPKFACPRCANGRLILDEASLAVKEPAYSVAANKHPDWEPDWETERFSLRLICDMPECGEVAHVLGDTTVAEYYDEEHNAWGLVSLLRTRAFFPPPPIIAIPKEVPFLVSTEIDKSFELFWVDLSSSANRLRISVELLLDNFKIPRSKIDKSGKSTRLDLNARISLFEKADPEHAATLTALRMIGNLGSHGGEVNRTPLLDAFEIYEDALAELCGQRKARIEQLRQKLISSKGKY